MPRSAAATVEEREDAKNSVTWRYFDSLYSTLGAKIEIRAGACVLSGTVLPLPVPTGFMTGGKIWEFGLFQARHSWLGLNSRKWRRFLTEKTLISTSTSRWAQGISSIRMASTCWPP